MNVDVFGHSPPPPGVGFQVTSDGNYNIDNKRLSNIQDAEKQQDAVNLRLVQRIVKNEVQILFQVTSSLRSSIDDLNIFIQVIEDKVNEKIRNSQIGSQQELSLHNVELIAQLDNRLTAIENELRKTVSGHRTT